MCSRAGSDVLISNALPFEINRFTLQGTITRASTLTHVVITGRPRHERRAYPLISTVLSFTSSPRLRPTTGGSGQQRARGVVPFAVRDVKLAVHGDDAMMPRRSITKAAEDRGSAVIRDGHRERFGVAELCRQGASRSPRSQTTARRDDFSVHPTSGIAVVPKYVDPPRGWTQGRLIPSGPGHYCGERW